MIRRLPITPSGAAVFVISIHFLGTYEKWQDSSKANNRDAVQELIRNGQFNGMVAYVYPIMPLKTS